MGLSVDLELYWRQKEPSQKWFYTLGKKDIGYTISTLSSSTFVPAIILAIWIGELEGFDEKMVTKIKTLIDFYDYSEVLGVPDNWPEELTNYLGT